MIKKILFLIIIITTFNIPKTYSNNSSDNSSIYDLSTNNTLFPMVKYEIEENIPNYINKELLEIIFKFKKTNITVSYNFNNNLTSIKEGTEYIKIYQNDTKININNSLINVKLKFQFNWNLEITDNLDIKISLLDNNYNKIIENYLHKNKKFIPELELRNLSVSDNRGNIMQDITINGKIFYKGTKTFPPDRTNLTVKLIDTQDNVISTGKIREGIFNLNYKASQFIEKNKYIINIESKDINKNLTNYYIYFDGVSNYIEIKNVTGLENIKKLSINIRFFAQKDRYLPLFHSDGWNGLYLRLNQNGGIYFFIKHQDGSNTIIDEYNTNWWKLNEWNDLLINFDESKCEVYINNELKKSTKSNGVGVLNKNIKNIKIGKFDKEVNKYFSGMIDEFSISHNNMPVILYKFNNNSHIYDYSENYNNYGQLNGHNISIFKTIFYPELFYISDGLVIDLIISDKHINVGEKLKANVTVNRAYDKTIVNGNVKLNDTLVHNETCKKYYTIKEAVDGKYNITDIWINDYDYVIWDRFIIKEGGCTKNKLNKGEKTTIWYKIFYDYDKKPFTGQNGRVYLNNTVMKWSYKDQRWESNITSINETIKYLQITSIVDNKYNISTFLDLVGGFQIMWENEFILTFSFIISISIFLIILSVIVPIIALKKLL